MGTVDGSIKTVAGGLKLDNLPKAGSESAAEAGSITDGTFWMVILETINFQVLTAYCNMLSILKPAKVVSSSIS